MSAVRDLADLVPVSGEIADLMTTVEWEATPLGPVSAWPPSLRTAVSICMRSKFPILLWWGPQLVMIYNDAYRPILGTSKHPAAMGANGRDVWPEIWDVVGPMLTGVLAGEEATWSEDQLLLLDRNGFVEECYFTFSYSPVVDESGSVGGVFTAVYETTGRVVGDRRIATLGALARSSVEAESLDELCGGIARCLEGNQDDVPFSALYLLDQHGGATVGASSGTPPTPLWTGGRLEDCDDWPLVEVVTSGASQLLAAAVGRERCLVLPMKDSAGGPPVGVLVAGLSPRRPMDRDYESFLRLVAAHGAAGITGVQALEAERSRAEALAELDRAKTTFFNNVSHEFRTPLTLLLGPVRDALATEASSVVPMPRPTVEAMQRNALRLLRLTNTLLDYSRLEAGRAAALLAPTDLARATADTAIAFAGVAEAAGLSLEVDCEPLPEPVWLERDLWEKVVLNLLSNAFKFTLAGTVAVRTTAVGRTAQLTVADTGVGIAPNELPRIFDRFHRAAGAAGRTHEGTGIGLAFVRQIVELHGGSLAVESVLDQGSTFTVSVPFGIEHLDATQLDDSERGARVAAAGALGPAPFVEDADAWLRNRVPGAPDPSASDEGGPEPSASGAAGSDAGAPHRAADRRILVVEDNADMRDYISRLLSGEYVVETAVNGRAALEAARRSLPHLVLSDVMMPGLDGFALLRALRQDEVTREVPVVLLSARAGEEAAVEGLSAGADDYLAKPFSSNELLARVRVHVELAELRTAQAAQARAAYEEEHDLVVALQRMLLPQVLPEIGGYEIEARYRSSQERLAVGGDWYDVIPIDEARVSVVIGDIGGHDLAAVGAMGQVRNAIRAYAIEDPRPTRVLSRVNALVGGLSDTDFVTFVYCLLDTGSGVIRHASAGHPPPLVVDAAGRTRWLTGSLAPPVSAVFTDRHRSRRAHLAPGETLVLFTDGLVERRHAGIDEGLGRLERAAATLVGRTVADMLEGILADLGTDRDDVALLGLRRTPV